MKIVMAPIGTHGDVAPCVALARELDTAGYEVAIATSPNYATLVKSNGCKFVPLGDDISAVIDHENGLLHSSPLAKQFLLKTVVDQFEQLPDIVHDAHLLMGCTFLVAGSSVAEYLKVPFCSLAYCPQYFPSSYHPSFAVSTHLHLPRAYNRYTWRHAKGIALDKLNEGRRRLKQEPVENTRIGMLREHVLLASDPALGVVPRDVKQRIHHVGYLHLNPQGALSEKLRQFLEARQDAIYLGFGSCNKMISRKFARKLFDSVLQTGYSVIVPRAFVDYIEYEDSSADVCVVGNEPHAELFPRLRCVIHNASCGSTATAAACGVPQISFPIQWDQFYWADRIKMVGIGLPPLNTAGSSWRRLRSFVRACVTDDKMKARCSEIKAHIDPALSLKRAAEAVRSMLKPVER